MATLRYILRLYVTKTPKNIKFLRLVQIFSALQDKLVTVTLPEWINRGKMKEPDWQDDTCEQNINENDLSNLVHEALLFNAWCRII